MTEKTNYRINIQGGYDLAGNRILKYQSTGRLGYEELSGSGFLFGRILCDSAGENATPESLLAMMKIAYVTACWQIEKEKGILRFSEEQDSRADALLQAWLEDRLEKGDIRAKDFI